jgi:predicted O-linked N-acetylglucosamine transferase (SPINDLY family)
MTTLELNVGDPDTSNVADWLASLLIGSPAEMAFDDIQGRMKSVTFPDIVNALERAGGALTDQTTIGLYKQWIASQPPGTPLLFAAWFNLGVTLAGAGDTAGAVTAYQAALALRPDFHSAAVNLGTLLESLGRQEAALAIWGRALQPSDARILLLNNRARLLEQLGRLDEAEHEMRLSLLTDPAQPDVIQHWIHVRQKMCQWPVLTDEIPTLGKPELLRYAGPLSVLALTDDIAVQRQTAADWIERKTFLPQAQFSPSEGYCHDRIRLGYLSSDFCRHAMSYLIAELFECHDRSRFEIYGYCSSPDDGSDIRARVIRSFDHFRIIQKLPDEAAAQVIRADEIDILIDLNGLTSGARPQILRWKPAPIQATYLGFVGPVPLPELDYMFSDNIVLPPNLASQYLPQPLCIADNYQANDTRRTIGLPTTRAAVGLPDDKFVFCCFSNHYKMTDDLFDAWMTILRRAKNSVLWIVGDNEWARRNILARAVERRIDPERIVFASRVGPDEYMARLGLADLFLDTFPYNAGTIASDAIRMGLPLVTLSGRAFASRMAGRLLAAAGARQGIATTLLEYVDIAVRLATDARVLNAFKACVGPENWQKEIGDMARFTTEYESTLLGLCQSREQSL